MKYVAYAVVFLGALGAVVQAFMLAPQARVLGPKAIAVLALVGAVITAVLPPLVALERKP